MAEMPVPGLGSASPSGDDAPEVSEKEQKTAREIADSFRKGLAIRRAHEGQWFVNGAFLRGLRRNEVQPQLDFFRTWQALINHLVEEHDARAIVAQFGKVLALNKLLSLFDDERAVHQE